MGILKTLSTDLTFGEGVFRMPIAHFSVLPREFGHKFIESRPLFRATGVVEQFIPLSPNKILTGEALGRHVAGMPNSSWVACIGWVRV